MNIFAKVLSPVFFSLPFLLSPAHAQFGGPKVATVTAVAKPATVAPGGRGVLLVTVAVGPAYHINAHAPNDPSYIATVFTGQKTAGIAFGPASYPTPRAMKLSYAPKPLLVYTGKAIISVPFTVTKTARPGKAALSGALSFQGCDAKSCYPPASAQVQAPLVIK